MIKGRGMLILRSDGAPLIRLHYHRVCWTEFTVQLYILHMFYFIHTHTHTHTHTRARACVYMCMYTYIIYSCMHWI